MGEEEGEGKRREVMKRDKSISNDREVRGQTAKGVRAAHWLILYNVLE